jgi:Fur family transcriptional regulator, iron response regulator
MPSRQRKGGSQLTGGGKSTGDADADTSVKARLRRAGLRPTRQRVALATLLFGKIERHFTAEMLFEEVRRLKMSICLATIYNTLHSFTHAGLLRQIPIDGRRLFSRLTAMKY